jgi:hypothetical protein
VLTPRRVALAAAEACWEGLLGLPPVKRVQLAGFLVVRAGDGFFAVSLSHTLGGLVGGRHCRLSVSFSSVRSRVRSSSQVGERKVREVVEIRYSPTTKPRKSAALGIPGASGMQIGSKQLNSQRDACICIYLRIYWTTTDNLSPLSLPCGSSSRLCSGLDHFVTTYAVGCELNTIE